MTPGCRRGRRLAWGHALGSPEPELGCSFEEDASRWSRGEASVMRLEYPHFLSLLSPECIESKSKAALPEQLQGSQVVVEQLQDQVQLQQKKLKMDGLRQTQSLECVLERQHLAVEMLLQEGQALKAQVSFRTPFYLPYKLGHGLILSSSVYLQLRQYKAVTQEQERERSLQVEWDQHMWEQLNQAESYAHVLESSLDLYKKKYQAALGRVGELESWMQHLEKEAGGKATGHAEKHMLLEDLQSKGQAEDNLAQFKGEQHSAQERGQAVQLTCQHKAIIQELQIQLAASRTKLLQQKEALAGLRREFASYKLTHSCSATRSRNQLTSQEILRQKLWQQAKEHWALVEDLKLELAREAKRNSNTVTDLARLELAVQSLCQEAVAERKQQQRELAALQHQVCQAQALLGQSRRLCAQKERAIQKRDRLLRRAWASHSVFQERARAHSLNATSREAKHGSWCAGAPVLQQRRPKSPEQWWPAGQALGQEEAAMKGPQEQLVGGDPELQRLGKVGLPLEALHGRERRAEAGLGQTSFLGGGGPAAAAAAATTSARGLLRELIEELSWSKWQPLQAASMLELEMFQRQLQEEWSVQGLQACMMEQKAENCSLQEQLTKQTAALRLARWSFRQAWLQLQQQAAKIDSLQISLEASRVSQHCLHQESELVVADVRQWVKEQKQVNEELGHKLRVQIKQIAQLTGERDLLRELVERLQQDNQRLKNEASEKRIVCERIKALHNSDLEPHTVLQQLWQILPW
ncbi:polyamine-modulated factor 1-binding protein 1 isoform X1 [Python bivittatus]|uniref:Polyamine-modulated factor 1-binding protein 1 isoform X1 n=1 Tax=Python bivittatus TaxID=176946 RepID=A0A9F5MUG0_PYTBI|nr:polyamine-modulated factor 1-binding protein 1 isoform X1 [Python bivittatus]